MCLQDPGSVKAYDNPRFPSLNVLKSAFLGRQCSFHKETFVFGGIETFLFIVFRYRTRRGLIQDTHNVLSHLLFNFLQNPTKIVDTLHFIG